MPKLGVNIDHIATIRQARQGIEPDPIEAALLCEKAGAHGIVAHLREDRRHINDNDILLLRKKVTKQFNLEMSLNNDIVRFAHRVRPDIATLVPEKRKELTTEGGLDVVKYFTKIKSVTDYLQKRGIRVSLFIDPVKAQILKAQESGAWGIELHTGIYDHQKTVKGRQAQVKKLKSMTTFATDLELCVGAGHGLKYHNVKPIARINGIEELNIGHSIVSRAAIIGISKAVKEMLNLIK